MNINNFEWKAENEWLKFVLKEVQRQLEEKLDYKDRFKKDALETQKEMWEELGSVSVINGLEQIVSFMGFIDRMKYQKRNHEITRRLQEKYERMLQSPYFGRIDFLEKGEEKAEKYYIGISNLINKDYDFLIYDWRAPASSMFYDYEIGKAGFKCAEGTIEGELTLKKQYKISNGKMEYMFDSNLKIDDEILQEILSKSTDTKMKAIVTTIQREQNRVIRNEEYKNLIVQGPAGSGKTSIALHRIAYLLYKHREKITPQNIVIFSPNQIFNDYISNVLPQLGEDNMLQTTFKEYMHKALGDRYIKEDYADMMEFILTEKQLLDYEIRIKNIKYKSSLEFIEVLKRHAESIEKADRNFKDIVFRDKLIVSSKELEELYYKDYIKLPLKRRLDKIRERILFLLKPYEKERINEIYEDLWDTGYFVDEREAKEKAITSTREETKDIYKEISRITEFDLIDIYKKLFEKLESEIKNYTLKGLEFKLLNYEDQVPLLYLKGVFGDLPKTTDIKYVIIDEAQDYTPLQYEIFYQLFNHANITMLGDLNQSINPFMNVGDYKNIAHIFPQDNTCIINLTKSYRSTMEITEFSRRLLGHEVNAEYVERSGDKPTVLGFSDENSINERIIKDIEICKEKGYKSIGIITRTIKEADRVYSFLKDRTEVKSLTKGDDEYINGTLVIPACLAKGLEFDVVFIYNAGDENYSSEEERLLFYTACTRALHKLNVYYAGRLTPLMEKIV
ncbi:MULTISPECIES: RNA polymerase recycling motor HelD [unclassified Clostridium]|uniref:RNA polymerase recycling motor HelD n=1 Tax=unclassified Clostridium TaxID=2614128 RepID=UPI0002981BEE|nr:MULTISPECIES: RNA polymerase recycling motor HelD [unclassified Clostridium]EKQ53723.1 MAG: DNA/RNA helicase, superfamily I [Clostridium sp. Maddingley MBC34-26]